MAIKLNSFTLPDNVIRNMRDQLNKTIDKQEEYGLILCTEHDGNTIIDRQHCKGNECEIHISRKCGTKEKFIGSYHTHPYNPAIMSAGDMIRTCKDNVNCIGGAGDNRIRCFVRKKTQNHLRLSESTSCSNKAKKYHEENEEHLSKRFEHIMKEYDHLDNLTYKAKKLNLDTEELDKIREKNDEKAIQYNKDVQDLRQKLTDLTDEYFDTIDIE